MFCIPLILYPIYIHVYFEIYAFCVYRREVEEVSHIKSVRGGPVLTK